MQDIVGNGEAPAYHYASITKRWYAFLLDYVMVGCVYFLVAEIIAYRGPLMALLFPVLFSIYHAWFGGGKWQGTPGKRVMKVYMIQESGKPISRFRALFRAWAYLVSVISFVGIPMGIFSHEKRMLHDRICKTWVVEGRL